MFTGLIEETGMVKSVAREGAFSRLVISASGMAGRIRTGDSVAVNGVCLTAVEIKGSDMSFDVMNETLKRSTLKSLGAKSPVNLEDAVRPSDAMGGHFVTGHVDCVGSVRNAARDSQGISLTVDMPEEYSHLVAPKGSIAIDGVSLTIVSLSRGSFAVSLIPQTAKSTTLGSKRRGDPVNIEFDIIGKYAAAAVAGRRNGAVTEELLRKYGFA